MENVTIPYVWKINDSIFRGQFNRMEYWYNGICWCYDFTTSAVAFFVTIIPKQLAVIKKIPKRIFSLIFGRKKLTSVHIPNYDEEVMADFWDDVLNN